MERRIRRHCGHASSLRPTLLGTAEGALSEAGHLRVSDGCFDIREHAELREDHRSRGVAVERLDLAVHETEDVTARRVHPLARWRKDPHRRWQRPLVRTLKGEFHDDDIADAEKPVQLAM